MKITELVKTYKLLNDPNAPDWNIKFVGGIAVAALLVAGAVGAVWWTNAEPAPAAPAATAAEEGPPAPPACTQEEVLADLAARKLADPDAAALPAGTALPSGCLVP